MLFRYISKIFGEGGWGDLFRGWQRVSCLALPSTRACTVDIQTVAEY